MKVLTRAFRSWGLRFRDINAESRLKWSLNGSKAIPLNILAPTNDVRKYIQEADCIVLPSYQEGTPRTLPETASSGKPIITTDVPGCNHVVINDYNSLLCKMKDAGDLAEKMRNLSKLENARLEEFGRNGRLKMEAEYDDSLVINKYLRALESFKQAS